MMSPTTDNLAEDSGLWSVHCETDKRPVIRAWTHTKQEAEQKMAEFQKTEQLGMIGKARFGTEFKHRLLDNGYATPLVDDLTAKLLRVLTGK